MTIGNRLLGVLLVVAAGTMSAVDSAEAQLNNQSFGTNLAREFANQNSVSRYTTNNIRQQIQGNSVIATGSPVRSPLSSYAPPSRQSSKPFANIDRGPTVSPYLALSNSFNQVSDYYNIVRPQQQQRRVNQQQQRVNRQLQGQNLANQRRLNQLAASGPFNPRGDENQVPTGHAAAFQSLGTYLNTDTYFIGAPIPR